METEINNISDSQKNSCAIKTMRTMLLKLSERTNKPFETVLLEFTKSTVYEALFDFETEIWKEGPDYLLELYDKTLQCKEIH